MLAYFALPAGCVAVEDVSPVFLLEAPPAAAGAGAEEADLGRQPRHDRRSDAQHDRPLVRRGAGGRQCESYLIYTAIV